MTGSGKPIVLVTGATGRIGGALVDALADDYTVVGLDRDAGESRCEVFEADLTVGDSLAFALHRLRERHGDRLASVVHLAAYFDFTGEEHPLYQSLNVDATRRLLEQLQTFEVGQFVYSGTMLVHAPCAPGERISEDDTLAPSWAYPRSKAAAEEAIRDARGGIPAVLLRLAGLYDETTAVPTLSHQIARIYERDLKGHVYAGDVRVGQSLIHLADAIDAIRRAIDRREELPDEVTILAGEPDAVGYGRLQDEIGRLIHGEDEWATLSIPQSVAKLGAWIETVSEPVIPDDFDRGERPFIRPFMIDMAAAHYALDVARAEELLGWRPRHEILDVLPDLVGTLKADPLAWYQANGITPPDWLEVADRKSRNPEALRQRLEDRRRDQHRATLWTHFLNMGMGLWLITSPPILGYPSTALALSEQVSGAVVLVLSMLTVRQHFAGLRWLTAAVGLWVMFAPLAFWAPTAAGYLNGTLAGALVVGFAVLAPPTPGVAAVAEFTGPTRPAGWSFSPSSWLQRLPIIVLAFVGLFISRHLAAYQLGHIDGAWDPFFTGTEPRLNGTEEIVTSFVSDAWPVPDAGLGGFVYMLEILTGIIGSPRRWRTMPWLVLLFGFLIVPLGVVSITFIVIQPILLGTWCTLCLVGAAAMLLQIPYSLDELCATVEFLLRRRREGRPLLRILFVGDTDAGPTQVEDDDFERPLPALLSDMWIRSLTVPWTLLACLLIGIALMFTRPLFGTDGGMADADHLVGSLVVTVTVVAFAELGRAARFLIVPLGAALLVTPFVYGAAWPATVFSLAAGVALIGLCVPRGPVLNEYGNCDRIIF